MKSFAILSLLLIPSLLLTGSPSFADQCDENIETLVEITMSAQKVSDNFTSPAEAIKDAWANVYKMRKMTTEQCELLGMKMMKDSLSK